MSAEEERDDSTSERQRQFAQQAEQILELQNSMRALIGAQQQGQDPPATNTSTTEGMNTRDESSFNPKNESMISKFSNCSNWESNNSVMANITAFTNNVQSIHLQDLMVYECYEALTAKSPELDKERNGWLTEKCKDKDWITSDDKTILENNCASRSRIVVVDHKVTRLHHVATKAYVAKMEDLQEKYPAKSQYVQNSEDFDGNYYLSRADYGATGMFLSKRMVTYYNQGMEQPQLTAMKEITDISNSRLGGEMFKTIIDSLKHSHLENNTDIVIEYNKAVDSLTLNGSIIYCPIQLFGFLDSIACMCKLQCPTQSESMAIKPFTDEQAHNKLVQYIVCAYQPGLIKDALPESYAEQLVKLSTKLRQVKSYDKQDIHYRCITEYHVLKKHLRHIGTIAGYRVEDLEIPDELQTINLDTHSRTTSKLSLREKSKQNFSNYHVGEYEDEAGSDSDDEGFYMMKDRFKNSENYKSASASSNTWRQNPTTYGNQRQLYPKTTLYNPRKPSPYQGGYGTGGNNNQQWKRNGNTNFDGRYNRDDTTRDDKPSWTDKQNKYNENRMRNKSQQRQRSNQDYGSMIVRPTGDNTNSRRFKTSIRDVKLTLDSVKSTMKASEQTPEMKKLFNMVDRIYVNKDENIYVNEESDSEDEIDEEIQFNELMNKLPDEHAALATRSNFNLDQLKDFHQILFEPSPHF